MGSPQPPQVMPLSTSTSPTGMPLTFCSLPLDIKYMILQRLDSFGTLNALLRAAEKEESPETTPEERDGLTSAGLDGIISQYKTSIHSSIIFTEFAPLSDCLLAVSMIDAAASTQKNSIHPGSPRPPNGPKQKPFLVSHLESHLSKPFDPKLVTPETLEKLHAINTAAHGISRLYMGKRGFNLWSPNRQLLPSEVLRLRRAICRCVTMFELYKQRKAIAFATLNEDEDEDEEEIDIEEGGDEEKHRYKVRNTFLSRFSHQEVLEMDCVRELMVDLAQHIVKRILTMLKEVGAQGEELPEEVDAWTEYAGKLSGWAWGGLNIHGPKKPVGSHEDATCTNIDANDHDNNDLNDTDNTNINTTTDTNTDTETSSTTPSVTPSGDYTETRIPAANITEALLLLGPIPLYHLHDYLFNPSRPDNIPRPMLLPKDFVVALLKMGEGRTRDIFEDEVMPFWVRLQKEYDFSEKEEGKEEEEGGRKGRKMPRGCKSICDVMGLKAYKYAVLEEGRLFDD